MDLYFTPFACSMAANITAREAGLAPRMRQVRLRDKTLVEGGSFREINPKGQVPALRLDDGSVLTEGAAVLQYLADHGQVEGLAPPLGSLDRYRVVEWLNYVSTELHKRIAYLIFTPGVDETTRAAARAASEEKLDYLAQHLEAQDFLLGEAFSIADAYLFWFLTLAPLGGVDVDARPTLKAYKARCLARPAVAAAVEQETALREPR